MSKRPATSEIAPGASSKHVKRVNQTDAILKMAKTFISTEAEVDNGSEEEEIDHSEAGESLDRVYVYKYVSVCLYR
jgi:hypothetical protein